MAGLGNLVGLAKYVWNHGDQLLQLLHTLPKGLRAAGTGLSAAGDGAMLAGRAFGGASAEQTNAAEVAESVRRAVEECDEQIQAVARDIRAVADALDKVRVPSVTPVKQHFNLRALGLGEHDFVTGITLGSDGPGLFGDVTSSLRSQADSIETNFTSRLHAVSDNLARMARTLDGAGDRLTSVGTSLKEGGTALGQLGS